MHAGCPRGREEHGLLELLLPLLLLLLLLLLPPLLLVVVLLIGGRGGWHAAASTSAAAATLAAAAQAQQRMRVVGVSLLHGGVGWGEIGYTRSEARRTMLGSALLLSLLLLCTYHLAPRLPSRLPPRPCPLPLTILRFSCGGGVGIAQTGRCGGAVPWGEPGSSGDPGAREGTKAGGVRQRPLTGSSSAKTRSPQSPRRLPRDAYWAAAGPARVHSRACSAAPGRSTPTKPPRGVAVPPPKTTHAPLKPAGRSCSLWISLVWHVCVQEVRGECGWVRDGVAEPSKPASQRDI